MHGWNIGIHTFLCIHIYPHGWSELMRDQIVIGVIQGKHWYSCSETRLQSEPTCPVHAVQLSIHLGENDQEDECQQ